MPSERRGEPTASCCSWKSTSESVKVSETAGERAGSEAPGVSSLPNRLERRVRMERPRERWIREVEALEDESARKTMSMEEGCSGAWRRWAKVTRSGEEEEGGRRHGTKGREGKFWSEGFCRVVMRWVAVAGGS